MLTLIIFLRLFNFIYGQCINPGAAQNPVPSICGGNGPTFADCCKKSQKSQVEKKQLKDNLC